VVILSHRPHSAELQHGLPPRLLHIHPRAQILLDLERKMFGDLLSQALVGAPSCY